MKCDDLKPVIKCNRCKCEMVFTGEIRYIPVPPLNLKKYRCISCGLETEINDWRCQ